MALNTQKVVKKVGFGEVKTETEVVVAARANTVSAGELANQIHLHTLLPEGVVNSVLEALVASLGTYMTQGHSVYVGRGGKDEQGLGIIYPRLVKTKTKTAIVDEQGNETGEYDVKVDMSVGVGLRPSVHFKQLLGSISTKDISVTVEEGSDEDSSSSNQQQGGGSSNPGGGSTIDPSNPEGGMEV